MTAQSAARPWWWGRLLAGATAVALGVALAAPASAAVIPSSRSAARPARAASGRLPVLLEELAAPVIPSPTVPRDVYGPVAPMAPPPEQAGGPEANAGGYWVFPTGPAIALGPHATHGPRSPTAPPPLPPGTEPTQSLAPPARFMTACFGGGTTAQCDAAALVAIDAARRSEGYGPLALPAGFGSEPVAQQLLSVANAERTSRGLPTFTANSQLDELARRGAELSDDPVGPNNLTWASNVAWGYQTPLAADFAWMYDDGVGSPNVDCTHAGQAGCWGHRKNILSPWPGEAGGAALRGPQGWILTQLFVDVN